MKLKLFCWLREQEARNTIGDKQGGAKHGLDQVYSIESSVVTIVTARRIIY